MQTAVHPPRGESLPHRSAPPLPLRHLLASYTTSHPLRSPSPLPPSSRVGPNVSQRAAPPYSSPLFWTIPTWIAFARLALAKGLHILWSLLSHFLFGPKRKSWGYRMTFITSFMRNVADHSSLADVVLIRRLFSLQSIIPVPSDAVVTPITFTVPRRRGEMRARGFMREWDEGEDGMRELTGEWVVGVDVWKRLKLERRARQEAERRRQRLSVNAAMGASAGSSAGAGVSPISALGLAGMGVDDTLRSRTRPAGQRTTSGSSAFMRAAMHGRDSPDVDRDRESDTESTLTARRGLVGERVIYYVHGGAYYVGTAATHRLITIGISKACNARVFAISYRLAPEHPFPLPLHDVLHGYLRLLAPPLSIPPENIIVMGDSAGGGLSLALCLYLRDEGYKLPAGLVLMSPWVDLTMSCGSWDENGGLDVTPRPEADDHLNPVACYLGPKGISTYLTHPYASPLFADLSDLPPMLIQCGDSEVLRDEVTLLAHKATLSGVEVTHELYEDMIHVFQTFTFLPAAQAAVASTGRWVRVTLPGIEEERERVGRTWYSAHEQEEGGAPPVRLSEQAVQGMEREMRDARMVHAGGDVFGETAVDPDADAEAGADAEGQSATPIPSQARRSTRTRTRSGRSRRGLHLDIGTPTGMDATDIDHDSLPTSDSDSGSGSTTPTTSHVRSSHSGTAIGATDAQLLAGVDDYFGADAGAGAAQLSASASTSRAPSPGSLGDYTAYPPLPRLRRAQTTGDGEDEGRRQHVSRHASSASVSISHPRQTGSISSSGSGIGPGLSPSASTSTVHRSATGTVRRRRPTASSHPLTHPDYVWMAAASPGRSKSARQSPRSPALSVHMGFTGTGSGTGSRSGATSPRGDESRRGSAAGPSPPPSLFRRLRSPTLTAASGAVSPGASSSGLSGLGLGGSASGHAVPGVSAAFPSTRARSRSHSDISFLVHGYVEGGAANETTVYGPAGEIRMVGVLGEEGYEEEEEEEGYGGAESGGGQEPEEEVGQ